jgi:hypothetical protein
MHVEPWGLTLYLQPHANYLLETNGGAQPSPTDVQPLGADIFTPESDSRLSVFAPVTVWPTGEGSNTLYRDEPTFSDFKIVWESKTPSVVSDLLTSPEVVAVLHHSIRGAVEGTPGQLSKAELDGSLLLLCSAPVRADIIDLLLEYGLFDKQDDTYFITDWGRQFAGMYNPQPQR